MIYIRCDGSPVIGLGHVTRMIALAEEIECYLAKPVFVMRNLSSKVAELVNNSGYSILFISDSSDTFQVNWQEELSFYSNTNFTDHDILIIDHYGYNLPLIKKIKKLIPHLVLIDDFQPDRVDKEINILVNPNFSAESIGYKYYKNQCTLLGPKYALLRKQFYIQSKSYTIRPFCQKILICFGGSDPFGCTQALLKIFSIINTEIFDITVIVGPENKNKQEIIKVANMSCHSVNIKEKTLNMAEEFIKHDLAILPSSTLSLEAASLGVPCCVVSCEDNQYQNAVALEKSDAVCYLGKLSELNKDYVIGKINKLISDSTIRKQIAKNAKLHVDSKGAKNVAKVITNYLKAGEKK